MEYTEAELLKVCSSEVLDVTYIHDGVVAIWHGNVRAACGKGQTLAEACRSFTLHNKQLASDSLRSLVESIDFGPCSHGVGYYYGAEENHPKKCYSCGEPLE